MTFDTGGISLKPAATMDEMKFDMLRRRRGDRGGLARSPAAGRRSSSWRLIGATENLPSGHAVKPGDIVRALDGTTVEVNNTDAEGRLVLADCIVVRAGARAPSGSSTWPR